MTGRKTRPRQKTAGPQSEHTRAPRGGQQLCKKIQGALSLDLLHPTYPPQELQRVQACMGHCYVATEAAYHLYGRQAGFVPYVLRHDNGTHWWLRNERTGEILDPTEPQLEGDLTVHDLGRRASFLTKRPSRRAAELIRRIRARNR